MKIFLFLLLFTGISGLVFCQNSYSKRRILDAYAYSFNGTTSKVSFPHSDSLNLERTDPFTIETWVKLSNTGNQYILNKYDGTQRGISIFISGGLITFSLLNSVSNKINVSIPDSAGYQLLFNSHLSINNWLQICITYDGSSTARGVKFYFSGKLYPASPNQVGNLTGTIQNTQPLQLGCQNGNYSSYKQSVTRIFKKVLSDSDIVKLYNNGVVNYNPQISRCIFDMQVRGDQFSTNYTVIDSALGNNGITSGMVAGQKVRVDSMRGMAAVSAVQTFSGNSIYYKTFGETGGGMDGGFTSTTFSPFTDRFRNPIVYDFTNNQTYVGFVNRSGIGFSKQSRLLKVLHDGKIVTPSGYASYVYAGQTDGHMAPSVTITPDNEILLVHEDISHSYLLTIEKTTGKSQSSLRLLSYRNDTSSYPQLSKIGGNLYMWNRYSLSTDDLFKSSDNGVTWDRKHVVTTSGNTRPYTVSIYDSAKLRYMITMLNYDFGGGSYTDNYYIESNDGVTFYNADHSFSKNIVTDGQIVSSELNAHCIANRTPGDSSYLMVKAAVVTPSGKIVSITNNGYSNSGISSYFVVLWSGSSWQTKNLSLPLGTNDFFVIYPYSDSSFVFWRIETRGGYNVIVEYRTTDFFDTIDAGTIVSATNVNHEQLNGTFNINDANKIVIAANALYPTENKLFIYEFTP